MPKTEIDESGSSPHSQIESIKTDKTFMAALKTALVSKRPNEYTEERGLGTFVWTDEGSRELTVHYFLLAKFCKDHNRRCSIY